MHGLQPVANIGQRSANNDGERIVEIRPPHLLFNVDRLNVRRTRATIARRRSQRKFGILIVCHKKKAVSYELLALSGSGFVLVAKLTDLEPGNQPKRLKSKQLTV